MVDEKTVRTHHTSMFADNTYLMFQQLCEQRNDLLPFSKKELDNMPKQTKDEHLLLRKQYIQAVITLINSLQGYWSGTEWDVRCMNWMEEKTYPVKNLNLIAYSYKEINSLHGFMSMLLRGLGVLGDRASEDEIHEL